METASSTKPKFFMTFRKKDHDGHIGYSTHRGVKKLYGGRKSDLVFAFVLVVGEGL